MRGIVGAAVVAAAMLMAALLAAVVSPEPVTTVTARPAAAPAAVEEATTTTAPPTTTSSTVPPTTTRGPLPPRPQSLPDELVAVAEDGQVVLLSGHDGSVLRVIAGPGRHWSASIAPDRSAVYYDEMTGEEDYIGTVVRHDLHTGARAVVATGRSPLISPDLSRLAYFADDPATEAPYSQRLVVRDLRTGDEIFWDVQPPEQGLPEVLGPACWADPGHLYVQRGWENLTDVAVVDVSSAEAMARKHVVDGGDLYYFGPACRDGDTFAALADPEYTMDDQTPPDLVVVDWRSGRVTDTVQKSTHAAPLDYDESARHLLYRVWIPDPDGQSPGRLELWRMSPGQNVKLADGYADADW